MKISNFKIISLFLFCFSTLSYAETITIESTSPVIDGIAEAARQYSVTKNIGETLRVIVKPKENLSGVIKVDGEIVAFGESNTLLRYKHTVAADAFIETYYRYDLNDVLVIYSEIPTQNQEMRISLSTEKELNEIEWTVTLQPENSDLVLSKSADHKSITFTPVEVGDYKIVARSVSNHTEKSSGFVIRPVFAFEESKVEGNDGSVALDEMSGVISNQSWIYAATLAEHEVRHAVSNYSALTIVGYDANIGLLIEYDETDANAIEAIEQLKLEEGISSVFNRVYEGENEPRDEAITPNDGSDFDDEGDNWHLEKVGMPGAWEFTTGSSKILIGISDSGFDRNHSELKGRTERRLIGGVRNHGNGVAGAIGAVTNNKAGMSGINWKSKLVLGGNTYLNLVNILNVDKVLTVNASWALSGHLPGNFDPSSSTHISNRDKVALSKTRLYRSLAKRNLDKLLVFSAGNGIGNGVGFDDIYGVDGRHHSPALHYDDKGKLDKQENVIFVAAMRSDGRLVNYSNYGVSVDLAAPTGYKSLQANGGFYAGDNYGDGIDGFIGTSAAAPVVTGIASLIYSINPAFTGKEVKDILLLSATEFVTHRHTRPDKESDSENIEELDSRIPVVNAEKAIELAHEITVFRKSHDYHARQLELMLEMYKGCQGSVTAETPIICKDTSGGRAGVWLDLLSYEGITYQHYSNGVPDGYGAHYRKNGELKAQFIFKKGEIVERVRYHPGASTFEFGDRRIVLVYDQYIRTTRIFHDIYDYRLVKGHRYFSYDNGYSRYYYRDYKILKPWSNGDDHTWSGESGYFYTHDDKKLRSEGCYYRDLNSVTERTAGRDGDTEIVLTYGTPFSYPLPMFGPSRWCHHPRFDIKYPMIPPNYYMGIGEGWITVERNRAGN